MSDVNIHLVIALIIGIAVGVYLSKKSRETLKVTVKSEVLDRISRAFDELYIMFVDYVI